MTATTKTAELVAGLVARIDALQVWFAAKGYGWRERATPGQVQQWEDREREEAHLITRLAMLAE